MDYEKLVTEVGQHIEVASEQKATFRAKKGSNNIR